MQLHLLDRTPLVTLQDHEELARLSRFFVVRHYDAAVELVREAEPVRWRRGAVGTARSMRARWRRATSSLSSRGATWT